jgi:hypothetical protein
VRLANGLQPDLDGDEHDDEDDFLSPRLHAPQEDDGAGAGRPIRKQLPKTRATVCHAARQPTLHVRPVTAPPTAKANAKNT